MSVYSKILLSLMLAAGLPIAALVAVGEVTILHALILLCLASLGCFALHLWLSRSLTGYIHAQRQRHEKQVEAQNKTLRDIIEATSEAFLIVDKNALIIDCNRNALKLFKRVKFEQVLGHKSLFDFSSSFQDVDLPAEDYFTKQIKLAQICGLARFDWTVEPGGPAVPTEAILSSIIYGDQPRFFIGIRDISIRIAHEQQLQKAREEAELANLAKNTFLGNISHELRNPLSVILGYSQFMQRQTDLSPESIKNLQSIEKSGEHLLHIINDVLEMSQIEAGVFALNEEPVDLGELIDHMEQMMRIRAEDKGVSLHVDLTNLRTRTIFADAGKLRQLFINLLSNAIKYTDEGSVTLRVDEDTEHQRLQIAVIDTGTGIPDDDLKRIFEPFQQSVSMPARKGTGLGLAISRHFAEMMDGELSVQSIYGKGSTFLLDLPFKVSVEEVQERRFDDRPIIGLRAPDVAPCILVVDDDVSVRRPLVLTLRSVGFTVHEAEDGPTAITQAIACQPDLIFMDVEMPIMDGFQASHKIKSTLAIAPVIIMLTAGFNEAFETRRKQSLADALTPKPLQEDELFSLLSRHLDCEYEYSQAS